MAFRRTKESAERFIEAVSCTTMGCGSTSELQYLGTACKHPYCWGCIEKFNHMNIFPNCSLCGSLLEPARPQPALLHNNLAEGLEKFKKLLIKYEAAVKREGANSSTQQMTQALFDRNFEQPPPLRTIDEFMSTQHHLDNYGLEKSRPCTPESPALHVKKARASTIQRKSLLHISLPDAPRLPNDPETPARTKPAWASVQRKALQHIPLPEAAQPAEQQHTPIKRAELFHDSTNGTPPMANEVKKETAVKYSPLKTHLTGAASNKTGSGIRNTDFAHSAKSASSVLFQSQVLNQTLQDFDQTQQVVAPAIPSTNLFGFFSNSSVPYIRKAKSNPAEDRWINSENETPQPRKFSSDVPSSSTLGKDHLDFNDSMDFQNTFMEPRTSISSQDGRRLSNAKTVVRPVMEAVESGNFERLQKVLNTGYNPNEYCPLKGTPLYVAVGLGKRDMCQLLIESGALINVLCGQMCNSPLHLAVEMDNEEIVRYLLSKGASKRDKNRLNQTAVELAADSSPLRSLVDKYRMYPRQPSVPPVLPPQQYILLDEDVTYKSADMKILSKWFQFRTTFDEQVTHFVVSLKNGVAAASNNFMMALLSGVHVISTEWLDKCLETNVKITADLEYEVRLARYRDGETARGSTEKWRKKYEKLTPGIFRGCKFNLGNAQYGSYGKRKFISDLILLCEGEVVNTIPHDMVKEPSPYFRKEIHMSPYFVVYDPSAPLPIAPKSNNVNVVTIGWLFQCMLHFSFFTPY